MKCLHIALTKQASLRQRTMWERWNAAGIASRDKDKTVMANGDVHTFFADEPYRLRGLEVDAVFVDECTDAEATQELRDVAISRVRPK